MQSPQCAWCGTHRRGPWGLSGAERGSVGRDRGEWGLNVHRGPQGKERSMDLVLNELGNHSRVCKQKDDMIS